MAQPAAAATPRTLTIRPARSPEMTSGAGGLAGAREQAPAHPHPRRQARRRAPVPARPRRARHDAAARRARRSAVAGARRRLPDRQPRRAEAARRSSARASSPTLERRGRADRPRGADEDARGAARAGHAARGHPHEPLDATWTWDLPAGYFHHERHATEHGTLRGHPRPRRQPRCARRSAASAGATRAPAAEDDVAEPRLELRGTGRPAAPLDHLAARLPGAAPAAGRLDAACAGTPSSTTARRVVGPDGLAAQRAHP